LADQAKPGQTSPAWRLLPALGLTLAMAAGCGPRVDPIEQARLAAGRAPSSSLPPVPGQGDPYPSLGSVPPRPETTPPAERQALAEQLVADRANARYVGQPVVPTLPRGEPAPPPARRGRPPG